MMFNSLNSLTKKLKGEQPSPAKNNQEMEGFICPMCMASFNSPDLVQNHFDTSHNDLDGNTNNTSNILSPSVERKESIKNIQENLNDLKQSLDEEVWFNKELQKEVGRLQSILTEKDNEINKYAILNDQQTKSLQESQLNYHNLSTQMETMRASMDGLKEEIELIKSDNRCKEDEIKSMVKLEEEMRSTIDQQKVQCDALTEEISILHSSTKCTVSQSVTDLDEMRTKASFSEKVIEELQLELNGLKSEKEQIIHELTDRCSKWEEKAAKGNQEKSELIATHEKLTSYLQGQLENYKLENVQLQVNVDLLKKSLDDKENKIIHLNRSWGMDQSTLENTLARLTDSDNERQKIKSQNQEMASRLKSLESEMMQQRSSLDEKEEEIKNLRKSHASLNEELNETRRLLDSEKSEKSFLQSQVEMTGAANIVMEQLQSEKKVLQENVAHLKKQIENNNECTTTELSKLRTKIKSQKEKIFNLNAAVLEKDEQIQDTTHKAEENLGNVDKLQKKLDIEICGRTQLEDEIVSLRRDLAAKDETLSICQVNLHNVKEELDKSIKNLLQENTNHRNQMAVITNQLQDANMRAASVSELEKRIELQNSDVQLLRTELQQKTEQLQDLLIKSTQLENQNMELKKCDVTNKKTIEELQKTIDKQKKEITHHIEQHKENQEKIKKLTEQVTECSNQILDRDDQMVQYREKISLFEINTKRFQERIEELENDLKNLDVERNKLSEDNASLLSEIDIIKGYVLDKEETVEKLSKCQQVLENQLTENEQQLKLTQEECDKISNEKYDLTNQLSLSLIQIDKLQDLYSDSMKEQNKYKTALDAVTDDFTNTQKCLKNLEEEHKRLVSENSKEIDLLRKEEIQLNNHVKALTKTLNESSENYKQERLEAADKEFSLKSQIESLQTNLEKSTKTLQRTEEDLESEKNLRESERNNIMGKISQLSEQITVLESIRDEQDQKLEFLETDVIENKLRLELANEEKDKLLEKIIQLENNGKKQTDLYSKKCRELDQLQSAILDLGRENQSLQISKEKLTSRHWIGDVDAIACFTCQKSFSLTLRKHHCRSCGQVYCQDCSSKSACLAAARNPVRVCDACYVEIQSHRKHSTVSSNSIGLSM